MATVAEMLVKICQRVDPKTKSLVKITTENIGTVDGKFTAERMLNIYNDTRLTVTTSLLHLYPQEKHIIARLISGNVVSDEAITFTGGVGSKPEGYIFCVNLTDNDGEDIYVLPVDRKSFVKDFESDEVRMVFEVGKSLVAKRGSAYALDGTYYLTYYRILPFVMSDVTGGVIQETYNDEWLSLLEEVAVLKANEAGELEISNLAQKFFLQAKNQG